MTDRQSIVFVQSHPRTLVLRPAVNLSKTALVFEAIDTGGGGKPARSTARFQPSETIDLAAEGWELLVQRPVYGTAGLVQVGNDLFIGIVTEAIKVGDLEGSPIYRILRVNFYSLLTDRYDANPGEIPDPLKPTNPTYLEESTAGPVIHPCQALIKLLSTGSFYFSPTLDLTRSSQRRAVDVQQGGSPVNIFENADAHFVWNKHLLSGLLQIREQELNAEERDDLDAGGVLVLAIQGYVGMVDFPIGMQPCRMALISRLSCKRAGTRLLSRGVNDDGHVSNFVETEFLLYSKFFTFSFIQIRGSVPVFWEQTGIQMTHKVTISRGAESSAPATRKHFEELVSRYNKIHVVNLLSQKDGSSEQVLGDLFRQSLDRMPDLQELLAYTEFDFHAIVKTGGYDRLNDLTLTMRKPLEGYSYFLADAQSGSIVFSQNGVVRTNCLDCLDRTNVVQTRLARQALATQLAQFDQQFSGMEEENFATLYNNLWADNGDWLSKIYAGTGALKSSFTRKGKSTMLGLLDDAAKSVNRFYINNFQDKTRQEAIDLLLGKLANSETVLLRNPLHEAVSRDMRSRLAEYSSTVPVTMFIGTYNVNGKLKPDSIETWLRSEKVEFPHLVAIGVQELIELTPGQYISADTNKLRLEWEATFMRAINDRPGGVSYVLLRSLHLVALGVFVFVRADSVNLVRHVESSVKKTGLGGMAANKGGIGISFSVNDTSVALVTAHLAAGQTAIDDRNKDYWTIHNGLTFRGRRLAEHDMIFWFGDFNYRINLPNDEIRARVRRHELAYLTTADQLNDQRREGLAFDGFQEGDVSTFDPTYKYDNGTQTYDTSEKARAPAWTDRILYRGRRIDLKEYARGEGLMSDHRPVRAVFEIDTVIIDRTKLDELQKQIYREKMATRHIPPPLPVRPQGPPPKAREEKPSTALLIDLAEDPDPPQQNSIPPSVPTVTAGNGVGFGVGGGTNAPQNAASLGFRDSFPPARPDSFPPAERSTQATSKSLNSLSNSKLPPPSSPSYQWWDKKVDEAFVVREGDAKNPFYSFPSASSPSLNPQQPITTTQSLSRDQPKSPSPAKRAPPPPPPGRYALASPCVAMSEAEKNRHNPFLGSGGGNAANPNAQGAQQQSQQQQQQQPPTTATPGAWWQVQS